MQKISELYENKYPDNEAVQRLADGYNPKKIVETLPTSEYILIIVRTRVKN